jgi:hypothetical protein
MSERAGRVVGNAFYFLVKTDIALNVPNKLGKFLSVIYIPPAVWHKQRGAQVHNTATFAYLTKRSWALLRQLTVPLRS